MAPNRELTPRKKFFFSAAAVLLTIFVVLLLANAICYFLPKYRKPVPLAEALPGSVAPPPMGRAQVEIRFYGEHPLRNTELPRPGKYNVISETVDSGENIFLSPFSIDEQGLRTTIHGKGSRTRFALFLGCSYTFGAGVDDPDTFPSVVASASPEYRVYNYSYPAYGPNDLIARIEKQPLASVVKESEGTAVYVFSFSHLIRALLPRFYIVQEPWHAAFREEPDGTLRAAGDFASAHPTRLRLQAFFSSWPLVRFLYGRFPPRWSDEDFRYTAKLVAELKRRTESELPGVKFLLVPFPSYETTAVFSRLAPFLDEFKVPYLNYRADDFYAGASEPLQFAYSGHPTPAGNRRIGEWLTAHLGLAPRGNK